jgi:hypothetical protein
MSNRCYRGCPNRKSGVWEKCIKCKKKQSERKLRADVWWLDKRFKEIMEEE